MLATDQRYKDQIGIRLTEKLIDALEQKTLSDADISYLATYVRKSLDNAQDSEQVFNFVLQLSKDWPVFSDLINEPSNPNPPPQLTRVIPQHTRPLNHHQKGASLHA